MIAKKMQDALNLQLNAETYSAYLYWSMSAALEQMGLSGFAHWMRMQAREELDHAQRFYDHITERGGVVRLAAIQAPPAEWSSVTSMFEDTLKHERNVTASIHKLVDQAAAEKDHAATVFLQWFVAEQVEEESQVERILQQLQMAGDSKGALLMLDRHMAARGTDGK